LSDIITINIVDISQVNIEGLIRDVREEVIRLLRKSREEEEKKIDDK